MTSNKITLKRVTRFLCLLVLFGCWSAPSASAAFADFGFDETSAEETISKAGMHPDLTTRFVFNNEEENGIKRASGRLEDLTMELPPGLVGNPTSIPYCSTIEFIAFNCPPASQVGVVEAFLTGSPTSLTFPLFNLKPPHKDQVARFGFDALFYPTYVDVSVQTASDYGLVAKIDNASGQAPLVTAETIIWGNPADPVHNSLRLTQFEGASGCHNACFSPTGERESGLTAPPFGGSPFPFLTNPTACEDQPVRFTATSYELPGQVFSDEASLPPITGCEGLQFEPSIKFATGNSTAGEPTGLDVSLTIPQTNAINLPATSAMRSAKVTLPQGMTISPGAADGLEACSDAQVGLGTEAESHCPNAAKLGSATFTSPALPEPLHGSIYQRTPEPGKLFRLWLVTDEMGLHLKLPGEVKADPETGQLTTVFEETPQLPVEEIDLHFKGGARAPLTNPDSCGTHTAHYEIAPWSGGPAVTGEAAIGVSQGCGAGGFSPELSAGVTRPVAGSFSTLVLNLLRQDGEEDVASFDVKLPKGQLAKLAGVPLCSDAEAAAAACPAGARIGSVAIATGSGPQPLWIPQPGKPAAEVYLAGPYKGAPYSAVTEVPAQAGPFDLGTVLVRAAIFIDPDTAQVSVKTDSLPQILEGVPVAYRTIHVAVDRKRFALAPTNCKAMSVDANVASVQGAVAHPSDRFQVGECAALRFVPKLTLKLKGPTGRAGYPQLTATLRTKRNESNIRKVSVALPHSEFLAQEHINTVCTRVQFAADTCPAGSVYGFARAVTPLLDKPLTGPVYLRSSDNPLPDLVAALHGPFDINLVGRIDSIDGGIRTTFNSVPDAPVKKFVLKMKGGKKSLLVNSTDTCYSKAHAVVKMDGQNGKVHDSTPLLRAPCGGR
jgi:hypothetical protein